MTRFYSKALRRPSSGVYFLLFLKVKILLLILVGFLYSVKKVPKSLYLLLGSSYVKLVKGARVNKPRSNYSNTLLYTKYSVIASNSNYSLYILIVFLVV